MVQVAQTVKPESKTTFSDALKNYKSTLKNSAVKNYGLNPSNVITDLANIKDAENEVFESIPGIGNIIKLKNKIRKTEGNIATNMAEGALKTGENVIDTVNDWSDAINNPLQYRSEKALYGKKVADEQKKKREKGQEEFLKRNLVKDFEDTTGFTEVKPEWEKDSLVKSENMGGQFSQAVGGMVPALLAGQYLGYAPNTTSLEGLSGAAKAKAMAGNILKTYASQMPANTILGMSSYGGGVDEALNEGATRNQARKFGLANAAIEQGTEMMTGGIPGLKGRGGIDQFVDPLIEKTGKGYLNAALKAGYGALGEGLEEYASTMLNPLAKKIYSDEPIDWKKTRQEARQAGLIGMGTGAFLNLPSNVQNFQDARVNKQIKNQQKMAQQNSINEQQAIEPTTKQATQQEQPVQQVQEQMQEQKIPTQQLTEQTQQENIPSVRQEPVIQAKEFTEAKQRLSDGTATERDRSFIKSAVEAQHTEEIVKEMDDALKTYTPQSNEKSMKEAEAQLKGIENVEDKAKYISDMLRSGKRITASDMAATELVLKDVLASKNPQLYNDILSDAAILGTEYGQVIQIMSKIKQMSPTGQLDILEKAINREKAKGNKSYANIEVTDDMRNRILDCYDENGNVNKEQLDNTMNEITQELADSMDTTVDEKARAWRYLSMLGNPKTHVRNIMANVAMNITKTIKDTVSAAGQDLLIRDKANKTATLKSASKDVKNLANTAYEEVQNQTEGNKYNEKDAIESKKQIFKTGWLEKIRKINDRLLTAEDQAFKKINFKRSFANYLTAQGISTQEDIQNNPQIVEKAKQFAINEANVATFNEQNKLAEFINSGEKKFTGVGGLAYRTARGAIIPFTRTPLNIAKRGIEYTPGAGMLTTISDFQKAPKNMKGTVLIDGISKQITGASLAMLGYALAKSGWVTAKTGDDKEDKFEADQGSKMNYSIKVGDTSYDLSWLSPSSMPFFVGVRAFETLDKQEGLNENFILESLASTIDPLSEMSCIESFTNVLKSFSNSGTGQIKDMAVTATQNYLSQFIPTVVGQFARTFDDTKRTTSADKGSTNKISQETYRKLAYKVPGLRNTLPEQTDYLGKAKKEDENIALRSFNAFLNPSNTRKDTMTKEGKELIRLYEKTGNDNIVPYALAQNIKYNGNSYDMTKKEYNQYKKTFGDSYMKNVKELMDTEEYKDATDDEKATMIEGLINYSKDKTKDKFLTGKGEEYSKTSDKVDALTGDNFGISDYYIYKTYAPNIVNGKEQDVRNRLNTINAFGIDYQTYSKYMEDIGQIKGKDRKKQIFNYINSLDLTAEQKQLLMKKEYSSYRNADKQLFNTINNSNLTLEEKESLKNFLKIGK